MGKMNVEGFFWGGEENKLNLKDGCEYVFVNVGLGMERLKIK